MPGRFNSNLSQAWFGVREEWLRLLRTQLGGGVGTLLDVRQGEQLVYAAAWARRHKMLSLVQLYKALAARMSGVS